LKKAQSVQISEISGKKMNALSKNPALSNFAATALNCITHSKNIT